MFLGLCALAGIPLLSQPRPLPALVPVHWCAHSSQKQMILLIWYLVVPHMAFLSRFLDEGGLQTAWMQSKVFKMITLSASKCRDFFV